MKHKFKQIISFLLVIALMMQLLPSTVFATGADTVTSVSEEAPTVTDSDPEVYILGEKSEAREENVKHYYLTDGSFMATQFQVPVHYEDEGQWVDIDNTLQPVTMFDGTDVYQAVNGEHVQAFAATLEDGTVMSMADGDASISMFLWDSGEEPVAEGTVPVEETVPEETAAPETEATEPTEAEETEPAETEAAEPEETTLPTEEETAPMESVPSETEATEATEPAEAAPSPVPDDSTAEETTPEASAEPAETVPAEFEETVPEETEAEAAEVQEEVDASTRQFNRQAEALILGDTPATFALTDKETQLRSVDDVIPDTLSSTVLYEDVYPGVDLQYDLFSYNVKESIIVKQPLTSSGENPYVFTFLLQLTDLTPTAQEDGSILLVNSEDETVYTIPAPYMVDDAGVYSEAVTYTMTQHDEGWLLTVTADESWMEDENRTYPVAIDPSFYVTQDTGTGMLRAMATGSGTFATTTQIACGYHSTYLQMQPFFKFTKLPELGAGSVVTKANLETYTADYISNTEDYTTFYIHQVTSAPSGDYDTPVFSYSNLPSKAPAMDFIEMNYVLNSSGGKYRYWNITRAVQSWYNDASTNHGLTITTDMTEATANETRVWFSIDMNVVLSITYRNSIGIEGYYTYETVSAGAAGTGYINDYTTNLTVVKPLLSYPSTTIPYSLNLVYNSPFRSGQIYSFTDTTDGTQQSIIAPDYSAMQFGLGWQLSCMESVQKITLPGPEEDICYVYRDGDGTQHYFRYQNSDGEYLDEDGLGLTMAVGTNTHTLEDKDGNKRHFINGYLAYVKDGNGNAIYFIYNNASFSDSSPASTPPTSAAKLTSIRAKNKDAASVEICKISYDTSTITFTDYVDRTVTCHYNSGRLESITHGNGSAADTNVYYTYDSSTGHLTRMYDDDAKYGIAYGYNEGIGVTTIKEYSGSREPGDPAAKTGTIIEVDKNGLQQTVYRYSGNDQAYMNDDDIITRYAFDFAGRTINATTLNADQSEIYGVTAAAYTSAASTSGSANRVEKDVQSGQNGINLLQAGGAEAHDNFTPTSTHWWKDRTDSTNRNAVLKTTAERARTGSGALKTWISTSAPSTARIISMCQTVTLEAGKTYTFSGYVNTQEIETFETGGGVYLAFLGVNNSIVASSEKITEKTPVDIENGWKRLYATYTVPTTGTYNVAVVQHMALGSAYADDLQLELGTVPSNVNLVQNGDFRNGSQEWSSTVYTVQNSGDTIRGAASTVQADTTATLRSVQTVPINQLVDENNSVTYLLSGWGKADSMSGTVSEMSYPEGNWQPYYGLQAKCNYSGGDSEYFDLPFNDDYTDWQYAACMIVPSEEYAGQTLESIEIIQVYDYNLNTVWYDNISLRKEPCSTYTYDDDGNLTAVNASGNSQESYTYAAGSAKLTKSVTEASGTYEYEYTDPNNSHLVTKIINDGVSNSITYDVYGNSLTSTLAADTGSLGSIVTSATYTDNGSRLKTQTDANGLEVQYINKNDSEYADYLKGDTELTNYGHTMMTRTKLSSGDVDVITPYTGDDRLSMSYIPGTVSVMYGYTEGMLTKIERGGYIPGDTEKKSQTYTMAYDSFGNMTEVGIGDSNTESENIVLATYEYNGNGDPAPADPRLGHNRSLSKMTYGNGDYITYTYDHLGRVATEVWKNSANVTEASYVYFYNAEGNLTKKVDTVTETGVNYEYDSLGRLIHSAQLAGVTDGGRDMATATTLQRTEHLYDTSNRISSQTWQLGDRVYTESYSYDEDDGSLKSMQPAVGGEMTFTYDALKRLSAEDNGIYLRTTNYEMSGDNATTRVGSVGYTAKSNSLSTFGLYYDYDERGNIKVISSTSADWPGYVYDYDIQGQLTKETIVRSSGNTVYNYTYDTYGNIRSVSGGENHTYTYGNEEWRDLLTAYDGQAIEYDEIGNPTSYYNGARWTLQWEKGRQLSSAAKSGTTAEYTYDLNGIRSSKTVTTADGTVTYNYLTQNGKVVRQTWGDNFMDFIYDNAGRPYATVNGNSTEQVIYYYILNQQGDVIRIVTAAGTTVATYTYNAWGEVISYTGWMAEQNPIRYRGYYFDSETGFYYCQSRYYDPSIGRFINSDELATTGQGFLGCNMFAYCGNNPVSRRDAGGNVFESVFDVISLAGSVAEVVANPSDPWAWAGLVGDVIDVAVPFVTGVGETTKAAKATVKVITQVDDVLDAANEARKAADAASDIRKSVGTYVAIYEQGKNYVGKGGFNRAIYSASSHLTDGDTLKALIWVPTKSDRDAFIAEFFLQSVFGVGRNHAKTFNKIWSPGRSIVQRMMK